jgi:hypothetical protein
MRIIHTDAPLMPLTTMVAHDASVEIGQAAGGRKDCFYGWGEAMADPINCKPHHLVVTDDPAMLMVIAETLAATGHQVVVTDYHTWSEDQVVLKYDDHHQH